MVEVPIQQTHNTIAVVPGSAREPSAQYAQPSYAAGGFHPQFQPPVFSTTNYHPTQGTKIGFMSMRN